MCAQTPSALTAPTALSAWSTSTALRASPSHSTSSLPAPLTAFTPLPLSPPGRSWFGSLPLSPPGCPWIRFSSLQEVFKGFQCVPIPPPPSPPSPPLVLPHRPQRFARHSTSSPTAFILCHCPHLVALGSGFQVFKKYLGASNVCPNPSALTAPPPSALRPPTPLLALRPHRHHHHPHCPQRSPPSLLGHCPHLAALGSGLCRCPHLATLGSGLEGANRSTETREFQQEQQTARKRLENLKTRSKPLERN